MAYEYTTLQLVSAELQTTTQFSPSTTPSSGDVLEWIAEESAYINGLANTIFGSTTYSSEYIDYDGENDLLLENSPLLSVTSVEYNHYPIGSSLGSSWETMVAEEDYTVYTDRGIIRILSNWNPDPGTKRIRVTYVAGYEVIPYQVRKLCTKLVAERVLSTLIAKNINERNDGGTVSIGSVSITEPSAYGIQSFKQLKNDIESLKEEILSKKFTVYRLGHI